MDIFNKDKNEETYRILRCKNCVQRREYLQGKQDKCRADSRTQQL